MAYMFRYDSVHGQWPGTVEGKADALVVDGKPISTFSCM